MHKCIPNTLPFPTCIPSALQLQTWNLQDLYHLQIFTILLFTIDYINNKTPSQINSEWKLFIKSLFLNKSRNLIWRPCRSKDEIFGKHRSMQFSGKLWVWVCQQFWIPQRFTLMVMSSSSNICEAQEQCKETQEPRKWNTSHLWTISMTLKIRARKMRSLQWAQTPIYNG